MFAVVMMLYVWHECAASVLGTIKKNIPGATVLTPGNKIVLCMSRVGVGAHVHRSDLSFPDWRNSAELGNGFLLCATVKQ